MQGPDLAWQELSQVFAEENKIDHWNWLAVAVAARKKSNSDEWVSALIILSGVLSEAPELSLLQRPEFYWIVAPADPSEFDRNPLNSASPHSPIGQSTTQAPGWQLTFYSFPLISFYLHTSRVLVSGGSVEICYLENYKINSSCEIFENPISAASID